MSCFCIFLETSAAQAVPADDLVEQCPNAVPESDCQPDSTPTQQHIERGAVTSGRGNGKMSGKRVMPRLRGTSTTYRRTAQFYCSTSHSFMKSNIDPPVITSVCCKFHGLIILLSIDQFKIHDCCMSLLYVALL